MMPEVFDPVVIVISRDEVQRNDTSAPLATLKQFLQDRESIRSYCTRVDICFDGYDRTREELFEIPQVRNYVYALDAQFPFWLYFLSREFLGLQCLAHCFLPPFLTEEARARIHPERLAKLIDDRWGPALFHICSAAGHTEPETNELLRSAIEYFKLGPTLRRQPGKRLEPTSEDGPA